MKPVLVVDDHQDIIDLISIELEGRSISSLSADNISLAIEHLKNTEFSCIFVDIIMDDTSSQKVIEYLKSDENEINKGIPIIVMSGLIDDEFIRRNESKVFRIIEKPFVNGEVSEIVSAIDQKFNQQQSA